MAGSFIGWGVPLGASLAPEIAVSVEPGDGNATLTWTISPNGQSIDGVYVGRDGFDTGGNGDYESSSIVPGLTGSRVFKFLFNGTEYTLYAQVMSGGVRSTIATIKVTPVGVLGVSVNAVSGDGTATLTWNVGTNGTNGYQGMYVGRNGTDTDGGGPYEAALNSATSGSMTFQKLVNGATYSLYAQPLVNGVRGTKITASATPVAVPTGGVAGWTLVKDFDMTANTGNVWSVNGGVASRDSSYSRSANMLFGTNASGYPTAGGQYLTILAQRANSSAQIYSVDALTRGNFSVGTYFRAEVVVQGISNLVSGMWPCPLWFRPDGAGEGEIDLDEQYGKESPLSARTAHFTIHKTPYGAGHAQVARTYKYTNLGDVSGGEGTHTYVIEKTLNKMEWFIDGTSILSLGPADASWYGAMYEVGTRWYPRITYQVGPGTSGNTAGDVPSDWLESRMVFSSIKLWEPNP